ncbi:MAG: hypothetical protein H0T79_16745 [Deltaproteobacteria bacterium]|nr:hypothetical protein [Deltaproteobacteria bacterium]
MHGLAIAGCVAVVAGFWYLLWKLRKPDRREGDLSDSLDLGDDGGSDWFDWGGGDGGSDD